VVDAAGLSETPVQIHWTTMCHFPNLSPYCYYCENVESHQANTYFQEKYRYSWMIMFSYHAVHFGGKYFVTRFYSGLHDKCYIFLVLYCIRK